MRSIDTLGCITLNSFDATVLNMDGEDLEELTENNAGKQGGRRAIRVIAFSLILCSIIAAFTFVLTPTFGNTAQNSVQDLYDQPRESVDVLVLGTSTLRRAISPTFMYEEFGIRSYNRCTDNQQPLASYYLLKESLNLQGNSISVVAMDVNPILKETGFFASSGPAERVATNMRASLDKLDYVRAMSEEFEDIDFMDELFPLLKYHSRWSGDSPTVLAGATTENDGFASGMHGQLVSHTAFESNASRKRAGKFDASVNNKQITDTQDFDTDELKGEWNDQSVKYFKLIAELCKERGIKLVLLKTPAHEWTDRKHDCAKLFADEIGAAFLDMTEPTIFEECNLSYDTDYYDSRHVNLMGSEKVSRYFGAYLLKNYEGLSTAEESSSGFSEDDLASLHRAEENSQLLSCDDLSDYIGLLEKERYIIFLASKGESFESLGKKDLKALEDLGFKAISSMSKNDSYVGVACDGESIAHKHSSSGDSVSVAGAFVDGEVMFETTHMQNGASFNSPIKLESTGKGSGSVTINFLGDQRAEDNRGLNFVVYDNVMKAIVDTSSFDTHTGNGRTSDQVKSEK